jgi:hypothetical protein
MDKFLSGNASGFGGIDNVDAGAGRCKLELEISSSALIELRLRLTELDVIE